MDEILNLIESVSEGFPSYFFYYIYKKCWYFTNLEIIGSDDCTYLYLNKLGKSTKSIPLLMKRILIIFCRMYSSSVYINLLDK